MRIARQTSKTRVHAHAAQLIIRTGRSLRLLTHVSCMMSDVVSRRVRVLCLLGSALSNLSRRQATKERVHGAA